MNAVQTPIALEVRLSCPNCGNIGTTVVELGAELRIREDDEGEIRELHPTVKKKAVRHACGQETLDEAVMGSAIRMADGRMVDSDTGEVVE